MAITQIPSEFISTNAISGTIIADNAITAVHIATNAVSGTLIADNAVTAVHIATNAVSGTLIADNAITAVHISGNSITAALLQDNAVGTDQLAGIARGKIIYGDSSGDPQLLTLGSNGTVLKSDGTDLSWASESNAITALNNASENYLVTVGATTTELESESGLTWDTSTLTMSGNLLVTAGSGNTERSIRVLNSTVTGYLGVEGSSNNRFVGSAANMMFLGTTGADGIEFATNNNVRAVIDSSGNVGIGETSPDGPLHITSATPIIVFDESDASQEYRIGSFGGAFAIYDATDSAYRMIVDGNGNIFKGHTSSVTQEVCQSGTTVSSWTPDIQINGSGNGGLSVSQWNTGNTASANLWLTKSSNGTIGTHGGLSQNEAIGRIIFSASDGSTFSNVASIEAFADDGMGSNDTPGRLEFMTTADGATTPTSRMTINNDGKVGIGTTSPTLKLDVESNEQDWVADFVNTNATPYGLRIQCQGNTPGTSLIFGAYSSAGDGVAITNNGLMGIGTFTPATELQIGDYTDNAETLTFATASDQTGRINFYNANASEGASMRVVGGGAGAKMHFANRYNTDADKVTFDLVNGRVGIGTTGPNGPLHVRGNNTLILDGGSGDDDCQIYFGNTSGGNRAYIARSGDNLSIWNVDGGYLQFGTANARVMYLEAGGNVGIGASLTDPEDLLHLRKDNAAAHIRIQRHEADEILDDGDEIGGIEFWANDASYASGATTLRAAIRGETQNTSGGTRLEFWTGNSSGAAIQERMRIIADGTLIIGDDTPPTGSNSCSAYYSGGSIATSRAATNTQTHINFSNPNGTVGAITTNGSATTYSTSSDYRLKENVDYTWDATTRLKQLKPARFNFKADDTTTVEGFLAHEVSSIVPGAISGEKDGTYTAQDELDHQGTEGQPNYQKIDQSKLIPLMVKTIQELEARIATLEG